MLSDPGVGRMSGSRMHNLSGVMSNDNEDVNEPKDKIMDKGCEVPGSWVVTFASSSDETYRDASARWYPAKQYGELTARIGLRTDD